MREVIQDTIYFDEQNPEDHVKSLLSLFARDRNAVIALALMTAGNSNQAAVIPVLSFRPSDVFKQVLSGQKTDANYQDLSSTEYLALRQLRLIA